MRYYLLLLISTTTTCWYYATAFSPTPWSPSSALLLTDRRISLLRRSMNNDNDNNDDDNKDDDKEQDSSFIPLDEFLDKPFFDPDAYDEKDANNSPLGWFAQLVKSDYELAETLYVGAIFVVLLIVSQELLRMQMDGPNYVPFLRGGSAGTGGKLF
jgi:hypothetical protein